MANLLTRLLFPSDDIARYSLNEYVRKRVEAIENNPFAFSYSTPSASYRGRYVEKVEDSYASLASYAYRGDSVVAACMRVRRDLFRQAKFCWREVDEAGPGKIFRTDELDLLDKPWPNGTTGELLARMITDIDLCGNSFIAHDGQRLRWLRPDWVSIVLSGDPQADPDIDVLGYVYTPGGTDPEKNGHAYRPDEICHWAPEQDPMAFYRGMSWVSKALEEVQGDRAATTHKVAFFRNGATLGPIVRVPAGTSMQQFKEFMAAAEEAHAGAHNAYKTMYLGGGAEVTLAAADFRQLDLKSVQGGMETRIAAVAGVHPVLVGLSEGLAGSSLNSGNFAAARRATAEMTLYSLWQDACGALEAFFKVPDRAELWIRERDIPFLREEARDRAEIFKTQVLAIEAAMRAGFKPDPAVQATLEERLDLLIGNHTGLFSVQMQPPQSGMEGAPPLDVDGDGQPDEPGTPIDFGALRADLWIYDEEEIERAVEEVFGDLDLDDEVVRDRYDVRVPKGFEGGGRFRKLSDRLVALLNDWAKGEGDDDPLDEYSRDQLRRVAKELSDKARADGDHERAARLTPRRGASSDEIKLALYKDVRAHVRGQREEAGGEPEAPSAPRRKTSEELDAEHRVREERIAALERDPADLRKRAMTARKRANQAVRDGRDGEAREQLATAAEFDRRANAIQPMTDEELAQYGRDLALYETDDGRRRLLADARKAAKEAPAKKAAPGAEKPKPGDPSPRPLPGGAPAKTSATVPGGAPRGEGVSGGKVKKGVPKGPGNAVATTPPGTLSEGEMVALKLLSAQGWFTEGGWVESTQVTAMHREHLDALAEKGIIQKHISPNGDKKYRIDPRSVGTQMADAEGGGALVGDIIPAVKPAESTLPLAKVNRGAIIDVHVGKDGTFTNEATPGSRPARVVVQRIDPLDQNGQPITRPLMVGGVGGLGHFQFSGEKPQARIIAHDTATGRRIESAVVPANSHWEWMANPSDDTSADIEGQIVPERPQLSAPSPTPAKKAPGGAPPRASDVKAHLAVVTSSQEAADYLDSLGLTVPQMKRLADDLGVPLTNRTKAGMRDDIVHVTVTGRMNTAAIKNAFSDVPLSSPTPAKKAPGGASATAADLLDASDPEALRDALDLRTVPELKAMLRERGLAVSGRKRELVDRLVDGAGGKAPAATSADLPSGADIEVVQSGRDLTDIQIMQGHNLTPAGQRALDSLGPAGHPRIAAIPDTEGKIREAHRMLAVPGAGQDSYVALIDVRKLLGEQVPRSEVDDTLRRMARLPDVMVTQQAYGRHNVAERLPAAVMIGGQENNLLRVNDPTLARPSQFPAVEMAEELVNRRDGGPRRPMMANLSDADLRAEVDRRMANDPITARDVASNVPGYAAPRPAGAFDPATLSGLTVRQKRARLKAMGFSQERIDEIAPTAAMAEKAAFSASEVADRASTAAAGPPGPQRLQAIMATMEGLDIAQLRAVARESGIKVPVQETETPERMREFIARMLDAFLMTGPAPGEDAWGTTRRSGHLDEDDIERAEVEEDDEPVDEMDLALAHYTEDDVERATGHDVTPGHDELHHYWTRGEGLARWVGSPKPWTTLVALLSEHVPEEKAKVFASRWFIEVFGFAAGSDMNRVTHGKPPRGERVGPG